LVDKLDLESCYRFHRLLVDHSDVYRRNLVTWLKICYFYCVVRNQARADCLACFVEKFELGRQRNYKSVRQSVRDGLWDGQLEGEPCLGGVL
jgi:hypothetical protein